ncbi:MAG: nitrate/sulfonate/bicarbonate ABC transporter ATP-binding protein [Piscirickettsiaceae bacterium]|nr:MAG: nitrate/sulfonate/bicarbonate ABC transporter ATP-binding protein [Piscirickettsiaceae bacterium]
MNKLTVNIQNKSFPKINDKATFTTIKNLYFDLSNNEFVCIVGPSGCGKTTMLNIIAGLDTDFTGSIDASNTNGTIKSSYVFQTPRLLPWRTVLENIQLANGGESPSLTKIESLLDSLGLEKNLNSYPHHLSLGMQRRVALARAFSVQSDILLMDEPFVSLDQPTARKARSLLLDLWHEQSRSVVFVTHDLNEAIELADRVLFLSESPSSIIADVTVDIPRSKRNTNNIALFKEKLKTERPAIQHLI